MRYNTKNVEYFNGSFRESDYFSLKSSQILQKQEIFGRGMRRLESDFRG